MVQLGRLETVENLNAAWNNEASDFTPWLQQNIDLLSNALGVDIQPDVEREVPIGAFSLDLLGHESGPEGRPVIIENQLGRSDHSHLGQLLTYAAGKKGGVIVWVAKQIRAEHREALEWLNDTTQENIEFYGVEVQLVKIGSSDMAPNFIVTVSPRPSIGAVSPDSPEVSEEDRSERAERYHTFFTDLLGRLKEKEPRVSNKSKVGHTQWLSTPSGKGGFSFVLVFAGRSLFRIELYIDRGNRQINKHAYDQLQDRRVDIEEKIGAELVWQRLDSKRACRIAWPWPHAVTVLDHAAKLEELKTWAVDNYFKFREVFSQALNDLEPMERSDTSEETEDASFASDDLDLP